MTPEDDRTEVGARLAPTLRRAQLLAGPPLRRSDPAAYFSGTSVAARSTRPQQHLHRYAATSHQRITAQLRPAGVTDRWAADGNYWVDLSRAADAVAVTQDAFVAVCEGCAAQ